MKFKHAYLAVALASAACAAIASPASADVVYT
jgi:hypothetical protein